MTASDIATLFLDRELRILRVTPRAGALFNILARDGGRALSDLHRLVAHNSSRRMRAGCWISSRRYSARSRARTEPGSWPACSRTARPATRSRAW
ncbi:MAG: PAS domain-containing protein [Halochromatium sp.]